MPYIGPMGPQSRRTHGPGTVWILFPPAPDPGFEHQLFSNTYNSGQQNYIFEVNN